MTAPISVQGLTRRFRRGPETIVAVDDVSFDLSPGELTVAAGPSGSGKTTVLSILAGMERSDRGMIQTGGPLPPGVPIGKLPWRDLAFVPQSLALLDELSVRDNIDLPARLDPSVRGRDTDSLLEALRSRISRRAIRPRRPVASSSELRSREPCGSIRLS